jgi:hypothetical protein
MLFCPLAFDSFRERTNVNDDDDGVGPDAKSIYDKLLCARLERETEIPFKRCNVDEFTTLN